MRWRSAAQWVSPQKKSTPSRLIKITISQLIASESYVWGTVQLERQMCHWQAACLVSYMAFCSLNTCPSGIRSLRGSISLSLEVRHEYHCHPGTHTRMPDEYPSCKWLCHAPLQWLSVAALPKLFLSFHCRLIQDKGQIVNSFNVLIPLYNIHAYLSFL